MHLYICESNKHFLRKLNANETGMVKNFCLFSNVTHKQLAMQIQAQFNKFFMFQEFINRFDIY